MPIVEQAFGLQTSGFSPTTSPPPGTVPMPVVSNSTMTAKRREAAAAVAVAVFLYGFTSRTALACECGPLPPPCEAYGKSDIVFIGAITEALETGRWGVTRARMSIDHAYKGLSGKEVILFDDGMCGGPVLQVGQQYLMYTYRFPDGDIAASGCRRSRNVKDAKEDLEYLNSLKEAAQTGTIYGQVINRMGDGNEKPLADAVVHLNGNAVNERTTTNGEGRYSFKGLSPGPYQLTVEYPGLRAISFSDDQVPDANVAARGCAVVDLMMQPVWRAAIAGRIMRANGHPAAAGVDVELMGGVAGHDGSGDWFRTADVMQTDEHGMYVFTGLPPGKYKIGVNSVRFPTEKNPWPAVYWPGARTEEDGAIIEVGDGPMKQAYNITLPPEPRSAKIEGVVRAADGKPVPNIDVIIQADNFTTAGDSEDMPRTDEEGKFSFTAIEGFNYRLSAIPFGPAPVPSPEVTFTFANGNGPVTLILERPEGPAPQTP
ncbi:MAG TPA: carboxypeptidase regulatory-like domain-containing protein [Bryobacteraceae bacterium]|nr:carboxypeptidase regulatory-like domain-containing protein [Bryobacteraceae bacterium]